jgi:hypothetical protein
VKNETEGGVAPGMQFHLAGRKQKELQENK